ncbi:MAG: hypothetical protein H0W65_06765 [Sphingomonas sp.]|uniref:hypothetical protein n=1 Tax=Sphingomonas sp. TaxID=28214 RepID=UPI00181F924F|nr:hypothetical protein [Sphingomonas sp.]MBA3667407.1 hypothetical protein [Sphingomonas sp.]
MTDFYAAGFPRSSAAPGGLSATSATALTILPEGQHAPDDAPPIGHATDIDTPMSDTRHYRHDGWTPAARAAFLDTLARSGVVTDACKEVAISAQAAYNLRNRDRLFAAGWDAALGLARARLADDLYARAVHGSIEQIWKDGAIVAERHRHDNRLSIAVLNRLDARCDRAERFKLPTQRLAANWDAYVAALAEGRTADAEAMLAPPSPPPAMLGQGGNSMLIHQLRQLRAGQMLDEEEGSPPENDGEEDERVWAENYSWRTNYPPPPGFNGDEDGAYGELGYSRNCTPEERAILDLRYPDQFVEEEDEELIADEAERDSFFAALAGELEEAEEESPEEEQAEAEGAQDTPEPPQPAPVELELTRAESTDRDTHPGLAAAGSRRGPSIRSLDPF